MKKWKTHLIAFAVFVFAVGVVKLVWDNPKVILYLILAVLGILAYGAIYLIVKAKMENKDS